MDVKETLWSGKNCSCTCNLLAKNWMYSCKIFFRPTAVLIIPAFKMFRLSYSLIHSTHNKNLLCIFYILYLIYMYTTVRVTFAPDVFSLSTVCYIAFVWRYTVSIGTNIVLYTYQANCNIETNTCTREISWFKKS